MTKRTQIYPYHKKNGHLVDYAGFELPVWFEGIIPECKTVRTNAGLFDVSHMGRVTVEGRNAESFLNRLTTNDVSALPIGHGHYSLLCNEEGGIMDDLTVFRTHNAKYLIVYNAANRQKNWKWLEKNRESDLVLTDLSDRSAMFAVQGPRSTPLLHEVSGTRLEDVDKYSGRQIRIGRHSCFVTRSGYTGEDGFEIYVWETTVDYPEDALGVWKKLLSAGKNQGLRPAGLGARDVLRLEAGMCLYGNDIDENTSPVEAKLNFAVRMDKKSDFVGRASIQELREQGPTKVRTGFRIIERGIPRQGQDIILEENTIGKVTSGTLSPTLGVGIGMGYAPPSYSKAGHSFEIRIRERNAPAEVVRLPFYQRRSEDRVVVMGEDMGLGDFRARYVRAETVPPVRQEPMAS